MKHDNPQITYFAAAPDLKRTWHSTTPYWCFCRYHCVSFHGKNVQQISRRSEISSQGSGRKKLICAFKNLLSLHCTIAYISWRLRTRRSQKACFPKTILKLSNKINKYTYVFEMNPMNKRPPRIAHVRPRPSLLVANLREKKIIGK